MLLAYNGGLIGVPDRICMTSEEVQADSRGSPMIRFCGAAESDRQSGRRSSGPEASISQQLELWRSVAW